MSENPIVQSHIGGLETTKGLFHIMLKGEFSEENLTYQIAPSKSHILWLVGHIANSYDEGFNPPLGLKSEFPNNYKELFKMGAKPVNDASAYPTLKELIDAFDTATNATLEHLKTVTDEELKRPFPEDSEVAKFAANADILLHEATFHTAYHLGQVSMLRRAQNLETGTGM